MVSLAIRFVVLGVFITCAITCFIIGCAIPNEWIPLLVLIPAAFGVFCFWGLMRTLDDSYDGHFIQANGWTFMLVSCVMFAVMVPVALFRCNSIGGLTLGLHIAGDVIVAAGTGIFMKLNSDNGYSEITPF